MNNSNGGNGIKGLIAGLLAGAAIGVLLAPRSGKETRELLSVKADEKKDQMKEVIAQGRKEWSTLRGKAADAATMTKDEADDLISFIVSEGKDLWQRVKKDTTDSADEIADEASIKAKKVKEAVASESL